MPPTCTWRGRKMTRSFACGELALSVWPSRNISWSCATKFGIFSTGEKALVSNRSETPLMSSGRNTARKPQHRPRVALHRLMAPSAASPKGPGPYHPGRVVKRGPEVPCATKFPSFTKPLTLVRQWKGLSGRPSKPQPEHQGDPQRLMLTRL